jgi:L-arabinose isomerase
MNHVTQGTQDLTNVLLRNNRVFGMESGHFRDPAAIGRLVQWLRAARAKRFAEMLRIGLLGHPFQDMGDFAVDETRMAGRWGPHVIRLSIPQLAEMARQADMKEVHASMAADRRTYDVAPEVTEQIHLASARLEWAMRKLVREHALGALAHGFRSVIDDGRFETLPFFGINKLLGEGLGYAGEGDVVTAGHMAQMRQLCGAANFTEIFTVDYVENRMLMMHMQECNPALARRDTKVRLVRKDFWAPGIEPYLGMYFTLEPGPVTLTCLTTDEDGDLFYIAFETQIMDRRPLAKLDVPHWIVQLDEPVADFLTRYSMVGGQHHLVSVPGHCSDLLLKLAHLQGFECVCI